MKTPRIIVVGTFAAAAGLWTLGFKHTATGKDPSEGRTTKTMTAEETFAWYDVNGDGFLTRDEFIARPTNPNTPKPVWERIVENFMRKDTNGDGKLSLQEWKTPPPPRKKPGAEKKP